VTAAAAARCPGPPPLPRRRYRHSRPATALPTWARVARALPAGRVPARSQQRWLRDVDDVLDDAGLRSHAHANVRAVATVVAAHARWHVPMVSRPTWAALATRTGLSRRTIAAHLAWLRDRKLLASWEPGRTAAFRPMALCGTESNQAAEYLLVGPPTSNDTPAAAQTPPAADPGDKEDRRHAPALAPVEETRTPTWSRRDSERNPRARAEDTAPLGRLRGLGKPAITPKSRRFRSDPGRAVRLAVAAALREHAPALRTLSDRHVATLIRDHTTAGWTLRDLTWALDHPPTGRPHWQTHRVYAPAGWFRRRLSLWRDKDARPISSPSQTAAKQHRRRHAEMAAARDRPRPTPDVARRGAAAARQALAAAAVTDSGTPRGTGPRGADIRKSHRDTATPRPPLSGSTEHPDPATPDVR